jgi:O-phospho-L-threonine phospho-lyase
MRHPYNLYFFAELPMETILRWRGRSYTEIVKAIMSIFVPEAEIPFQDLSNIIDDAFSTFDNKDVLPLAPVGDVHILEMFHGQTGAFKDLAMSIIGRLIEYFLKKSGKYATIVVGTSGDTGSAAIYAVRGRQRVDIIVLYPHGRISEIQQLQMVTSPDSNVHVFACDGTSDDLDEPIKYVLNDAPFVAEHSLCSINSINWARVMIQIAHFFYSYLATIPAALQTVEEVSRFELYASVPTGACGNLVGAWLAREMGLPIKIVAGVNENDIIHRAMLTGNFSKAGAVEKTIAPSMGARNDSAKPDKA